MVWLARIRQRRHPVRVLALIQDEEKEEGFAQTSFPS